MAGKRVALALGLVMACGSSGKEARKPTVALELTGAVTVSLTGQGGSCETNRAGTDQGVTIRSSDLGAQPELVLYLGAVVDKAGDDDHGSVRITLGGSIFVSENDPGVTLSGFTKYAIDSTMKEDGGDRTIRIRGSVTCPPP
jgi:hypothetical protein